MTIIFVGNTSWSMWNFREEIIRAMLQEGHTVYVLSPADLYTDQIIASGAHFIPLMNLSRKGLNPLHEYKFYKELRYIYKKIKPDLIFHYTIKPNIYGSLAASGIKSIAVTTGLGYVFINGGILSFFVKQLYKHAFRRVESVWFLNKEDADVFLRLGLVSNSKIFILNGEGVNTNLFAPTKVKNEKFTFILVARMLYDKGIKEFVKASTLLKSKGYFFDALLLGQLDDKNPSGIPMSEIQKWEHTGCVKYLGATSDVIAVLENATCVVLPSYREGVPRSLMEAAAMSKPIVTTNSVGCREVVTDGVTGFLCVPRDHIDLASKMEKMLNLTQDELNEMGIKGREKMIAEFDIELVKQIYIRKVRKLFRLESFVR